MSEVANVPIQSIVQSSVALRPVNRSSEKYLQLVESIRNNGIFNPIVVREIITPEGENAYGLIDGLHRFTAAQDAGLTTVPVNIKNVDDAELLVAQIVTNIHKFETKPVEYSKQLVRILMQNPLMTLKELAKLVSQSDAWVSQRLGLVKLDDKIVEIVDSGRMNLSNAYALAKLPVEEQADFVDRAMTDQPQEFLPIANQRIKAIRDAKAQGRDADKAEFQPVPFPRKIGELKDEYEKGLIGPVLCRELTTPAEGFAEAVKWFLHMDENSKREQIAKNEARVAKLKEEAAKRKAEREAKKRQAAVEVQADISKL